jgi:hypothetical protein
MQYHWGGKNTHRMDSRAVYSERRPHKNTFRPEMRPYHIIIVIVIRRTHGDAGHTAKSAAISRSSSSSHAAHVAGGMAGR